MGFDLFGCFFVCVLTCALFGEGADEAMDPFLIFNNLTMIYCTSMLISSWNGLGALSMLVWFNLG